MPFIQSEEPVLLSDNPRFTLLLVCLYIAVKTTLDGFSSGLRINLFIKIQVDMQY